MLRAALDRLTAPRDIQVLKTYGAAPYAADLKKLEKQIKEKQQSVNEKIGVKVCGIDIGDDHGLIVLGIGYGSRTSTPVGCSG